ncbi:vanadium-dependent haloperoxidase [Haloarcula salinisoli]|uniref:Vanadium-dependent haloperoxidase n=1 Tax=Haloarcula salinisoli TaxID=2487746 RepID=A0A8J7YMV5_9EURY|nr:vanadium-dependent haloperoxidase [Halomicroarcula salinisoli]MBX0287732.1 vanadium-dependent haloperoxidase [Halomicroarcula salinisoli]MBX0304656.1 vanadium-dependent haloperoxidase [Halomicroarcula salinisoli]
MGNTPTGSNSNGTDQPAVTEQIRERAAEQQTDSPDDWTSPDERQRSHAARYVGSFTKLLEHDSDTGLLTEDGVEEFERLERAIRENDGDALDAVTRANETDGRRWISPRSANAGSMKGVHPSLAGDRTAVDLESAKEDGIREEYGAVEMTEPHPVDSPEAAAELLEAYLFAVCRDVEFDDYGTGERTDDTAAFDSIDSHDSITRWAADKLNAVLQRVADRRDENLQSVAEELEIPTAATGGVTPETLFRGYSRPDTPDRPDDLTGQFHSQFVLQQLYPLFPSGCAPYVAGLTGVTELDLDALAVERHVPIANRREFGVTFDQFVALQNGEIPETYREEDFESDTGRYPITGRDLGTHVHTDGPYQEYYRAATVLLFWDFPRTTQSPYTPDENGRPTSPNEADGVTFGPVDPFSLVGAVSYEAFKAAWAQKWRSFTRLRPEAMAGLVDLEQRQDASPLDEQVVDDLVESDPASAILDVVAEFNGRQRDQRFVDDDAEAETYLLGQMYPEGSPTHPSYPSGHATMAGAGVTVLKALFDDTADITTTGMRPVGIDPDDPTEHVFIDRGDHADDAVSEMTVGSELDKLASNIAHARMFGGVHFRSDGERGIRLGEQVAIRFLQDHLRSYPETEFGECFEFTSRNGTRIRVTPDSVERAPDSG